jgi:serine/threonine protein phosphatase PrpC
LLRDEPFNAKRVLEALVSLLPLPCGFGTPELVRLFLPAWNSSTPKTCSVVAAREVAERAEAVSLQRSTKTLAELCDPGLRRNHNEDSTGIAQGETAGEPWSVLVVCDGVSSSTHAEQASNIAAKVATSALAHFARSGDIMHEGVSSAVLAAIRAAHLAVCTSGIEYGDGAPPGTTIVAGVIFRKRLTVGWVGDSRAYWVSDQGAELCTTDHSWVNDTLARGEMTEAEAMASPLAHALTRCLGPLETGDGSVRDVEPDVRSKALPGPGHVVLCTDGLWNYFPTASLVAGLVRDAGVAADPSAIARFLVCQALSQGGGDNVSVAVYEAK